MSVTPAQAAKKSNGVPYWTKAIAIFFVGWIFIYATRNILSAAMPTIQMEFGLSASQLGLLNSVFYFTYTFAQIPAGMLGDRGRLKMMIIIGFCIFGIFTGLTGFATSFIVLIIIRAIVGIGQGTYYGPQYALSTTAIPLKRRGFGSSIINSGMAFGTSLGLLGAGFIMNTLGLDWRFSFFFFAIPTLIIALLVKLFIRENPPENEIDNSAEAQEMASAVKKKGLSKKLICLRRIDIYHG
jgi:sugar phosphate permease